MPNPTSATGPSPTPSPDATRTVARNAYWTALELGFSLVATFIVSIAVARVVGPRRLGYFNFVQWMMLITGSVASVGLPLTTLKYMSEFIAKRDEATAHAVFRYALRFQTLIAVGISAIAIAVVLLIGAREYRLISLFLALAIVPQMVTAIPSQANVAAENFGANTRASVASAVVNVVLVAASLLLGFDLLGVAIAVLTYRSVDAAAKLIPIWKTARTVPRIHLPDDLRKRMFRFSSQGTGLMILQLVVWDRSDMIFLKLLQSDTRQLAFFSVAFNLVERLLLIPQPFVGAFGATQMAEHSRDNSHMLRMTGTAVSYTLLIAAPLLAIAAVLSRPVVAVLYGSQYFAVIPVLTLTASFGISKCLKGIGYNVLFCNEDLGFVLKSGLWAGILNVVLDVVLVPHYAAIGAAMANGSAQVLGGACIWVHAIRRYGVPIDLARIAKIVSSVLLSAAAAYAAVQTGFSPLLQGLLGTAVGLLVYILCVRVFRVLGPADRLRLRTMGRSLPGVMHPTFNSLVGIIASTSVAVEDF